MIPESVSPTLDNGQIETFDNRSSSLTRGNNETQDDFQKWRVIASASAFLFVGIGYSNTFGVFQEYYQTVLFPNESPMKLLAIGSVASSLYLILGAFTGRFADLVGYRISVTLGAALMIGSMFVASVSKEYWQFFLSQGLMFGLGVAFAYLPAVTISRQYFGSRKHGLANGIVVSGGALGGCFLPYCVRELLYKEGLPQAFRVLGYIAIGILTPSIVFLKPRAGKLETRRSRENRQRPLMDLSLLKDARFDVLLVAGTIAMTGFLPRYFLIPPSAIAKGVSSTYTSWLLGLMNGLSIVGRVGIGWLADRHGKVNALSASFILCGIGHFVFWLPGVALKGTSATTALFTLFVVYTGIFGSGFVSLFPVVVAHLFGADSLASKVGLLNTVTGLGTLAGPAAVYAIIGEGTQKHWVVGVLSAGLFMFVGGLMMATALSWISKATKDRDEEHPLERTMDGSNDCVGQDQRRF
ncbi:hypothetical protein EG329_005765 [Mollisiaceae sp. DMI_Dod_QoI]|nr:hypothetical protein EG329_005765 [Helotiales sp. DMI_Dod_QoI]